MSELYFRAEDLKPEEIVRFFVASELDEQTVEALQSRRPIIIVGSRGVGKSFLMRYAAAKQGDGYATGGTIPVYLSFIRSGLMALQSDARFRAWMISRIAKEIIATLRKKGLLDSGAQTISRIIDTSEKQELRLLEISLMLEREALTNKAGDVDIPDALSTDDLKEAVEEICTSLNIERINLFIDEAAHVFSPKQQRAFFTLFRDLRSPYLTCNAAVYPGITSYGDVFQPAHDATFIRLDRDLWASSYVDCMKDIVTKQASAELLRVVEKEPENFRALAYAATGNPRILLKTLTEAKKLSSKEIQSVFRTFYRETVWGDHSLLGDTYKGHRPIIDWGRKFVEQVVADRLGAKSSGVTNPVSFWVHRDAPEGVHAACRILEYSGIIRESGRAIRATRGAIGNRYLVNLGTIAGAQSLTSSQLLQLISNSKIDRVAEFGANYPDFQEMQGLDKHIQDTGVLDVINERLASGLDVLDLTAWQLQQLRNIGFKTVKDVLDCTEDDLHAIPYVGPARSRQMKNAAEAAVLEFLSG